MASFKFAFIADMHHYSQALGVSGRAYMLRSGADQKCLAETGAVIDEAFSMLGNGGADCVCIAGDITNDGERVSHNEMYDKLLRLNEKKKVYLIPSTHDWCSDSNARSFSGDTVSKVEDVLSPAELTTMYSRFGENDIISSFVTPIGLVSKCYRLSDNIRLLAICDDCNGAGGKSGYDENHLSWILSQIESARNDSCAIIGMEHHLLLYNISPLINKGQSIADNYEMAEKLADAGLKIMVTGHSHMQRTTRYVSAAGNEIYQINLGSLCGYPAPVTYIDIEDGKANISVDFLKGFTYNSKYYDASFFSRHTADVLYNLLNSAAADKQDFADRLNAIGIHIRHYDSLYPAIKLGASKTLKITVGKAGKIINRLTFGRGVDKNAVREIKNEKLLGKVLELFLNVFDGSLNAPAQNTAMYVIANDIGRLPVKVLRKIPLPEKRKTALIKAASQIESIVTELICPSAPDNFNCTVSLS